MRKVIVILLIFIYGFPSLGLSFSLHYCGGELTSFSLGHEDHPCSCGSKVMKKDCCKDETITFKNDDKQQKTEPITLSIFGFYPVNLTKALFFDFSFSTLVQNKEVQVYESPPPIRKQAIFLLNNVFRI